MATFVAAMASAETTSTEIGHSLSGIFGCISLVAWICLLVRSAVYGANFTVLLTTGHSCHNLSPTTKIKMPTRCLWASSSFGCSVT